jgi:hypothetical protein
MNCLPLVSLCSVAMKLVFRFERDGVDAGMRGLLGLPVHPELGRERVERSLGRIALHRSDPFPLEHLAIVSEHGHAAHQPKDGILARRRLAVFSDFAVGCVAAQEYPQQLMFTGWHS